MNSHEQMKIAIQLLIQSLMDRVMENVLYNDPFVADKHRAEKPIYAALVPDEIFKGSHFERRFVTSFGAIWEKLTVEAAKVGMGNATTQYRIDGNVGEERLRRISEILNRLEHRARGNQRTVPNWEAELSYVLAGDGEAIPTTVICDVFCENVSTQRKYAFELKAPLPNSDQTKVSKEKLLKLYAMDTPQVDAAYFALPYNPYGKRENYAWSFPGRWFDMKNDPVVLIGEEFWDVIGGQGTYQAFVDAINEIGLEYKQRIYREFLGIEPPDDGLEAKL